MDSDFETGKCNHSVELIAKVLVIMTKMSEKDRQDAASYWNTTVAGVITQAMQENDDFIRGLSPFSNMVCHQLRNAFPCRTNMIAVVGCDIKSINFLNYNVMEPRFVNGMLLISNNASDQYFSDVISTKVVMSMWLNDFMSHLFFITNKFYETVFSIREHSKMPMYVAGNVELKHAMETFFPSIVQWSIQNDSTMLQKTRVMECTQHVTRQAEAEVDYEDVLIVPVYEEAPSAGDLLLTSKCQEENDGAAWDLWSG